MHAPLLLPLLLVVLVDWQMVDQLLPLLLLTPFENLLLRVNTAYRADFDTSAPIKQKERHKVNQGDHPAVLSTVMWAL
jgi:hypothetical protein